MIRTIFLALLVALSSCQKDFKAEVKKQKVGDVELAYYTRGSGEPLVMIMGFRGTMAIWDPGLIDELAKKYTLILFDNRGAGMSTDTPEDHTTIKQMSEDTVGLIKALGYDKIHLLGWSMGTQIAMQVAFNHPEILKTLILCSPNPLGKYQAVRTTDSFARLTTFKPLHTKEALALLYPETTEGREASAGFVLRLAKAIEEGSVPNDLNVSQQTVERQAHAIQLIVQDNSIYEKLGSIKVPTLVAGGLSDVLDQPENTRTVAARIPYAWAAYFPGAGHAFSSQDNEEFGKLVNVFIDSNN